MLSAVAAPRFFERPRQIAIGLALFGFVVRLGLAIMLGLSAPPRPGSDQNEYDTYAWNLAQGRGYRGMSADVADQDHLTAYRPPGPSLVWAGLYKIFGHRYDVIRIMHCLVGAVSVLLVYEIGRRCYSDRVGLLAAATTAVFPTALLYTVDLLSEALGIFWFLATILACLWFAERPSVARSVAAGGLLGVCILTRPNSIFMVPLLALWGAWQFRGQWRQMLQAATICLVAGAVLAPWAVRNYVVFHKFIPLSTMAGSGLLQGNNDLVVTDPRYFGYSVWDSSLPEYRETLKSAGDEVERDKRAKDLAIEWLKNNPDQWWFLVRHRFWRSLTPFLQPESPRLNRIGMLVAWGPVLVLFSLAYFPTLAGFLRRRQPGWLLHLGILHYLLTSVLFYALARYRISVEPLCFILAIRGVEAVVERLKRGAPAPENQPLAPPAGAATGNS